MSKKYAPKYVVLAALAVALTLTFQNCGQPGQIVENRSPDSSQNEPDPVTLITNASIKINNGAAYTNNTTVMLQLMAVGAEEMLISNFQSCEGDGAWEPYSQEKTWQLSDSNKPVSVFVRYRKTGAPATDCIQASITHDNIAPKITVTKKAPAFTKGTSATINFEVTDENSGIQTTTCKLNETDPTDCSSTYTFANLTDEKLHKVLLVATDKAGNISEPVTESVVVDRTPPKITINGPKGLVGNKDNSFQLMVTDENKVGSVKCRLSPTEAALKDCSSLNISYKDLSSGPYQFFVQALDAAGNQSDKDQSFEIDLSVPSVNLIRKPLAIGNKKDVEFEYNGKSGTRDLTKFKCSLTATGTAASYQDCSSPKIRAYQALSDKSYDFKVVGTNDVGRESTPVNHTFIVDTLPPTVSVTRAVGETSKSKTATLSIQAADLNGIKSIRCQLNSGNWSDCSSKMMSYTNLADGTYTFVAEATDNAGNIKLSSPLQWVVDTSASSEILASFRQNPVKLGEKAVLDIKLVMVTDASYNCKLISNNQAIKTGALSSAESVVDFPITEDSTCEIKGLDKDKKQIAKSVSVKVSCGNSPKDGGRCIEFTCKSYTTLAYSENLKVPARTSAGQCYVMKLFNSIQYASSSVGTVFDTDVISKDHDTGTPYTQVKNPYLLNKALINFKLDGPRIAKLAGAPDANASIVIDNFVMVGLYPQAIQPLTSHYKAYGSYQASADDNGEYVLYKKDKIPLKSFGYDGKVSVTPLEIVREADTNLDYMLDIRALDCGGVREMSDVYLIFQ